MFQQLFKNLRIIRKNCFPAPFWADMVMKEDSLGVGVPGHQVNSKSRYMRRSQNRIFEFDMFCSLISFVVRKVLF